MSNLVRLDPGVFRAEVVRGIEVEWIHLLQLHELQNFHNAGGRRLDFVQLFFGEEHVLVFFVLVALHNFGALHNSVVDRAKKRLLEP